MMILQAIKTCQSRLKLFLYFNLYKAIKWQNEFSNLLFFLQWMESNLYTKMVDSSHVTGIFIWCLDLQLSWLNIWDSYIVFWFMIKMLELRVQDR